MRSSEPIIEYLLTREVFGVAKALRDFKVTISGRECYWIVVYWYYSNKDSIKTIWIMSSTIFLFKLF